MLLTARRLFTGTTDIADRTGTLEIGNDADILAVAGDPLADIAAIHDVAAVFARGRRAAASATKAGTAGTDPSPR